MTATPIEDYALIGDGETAALVSRGGSIDWLCWPRFDSDACFAALLGSDENGRWQIAPAGEVSRTVRRYRADTLILETEFETPSGAVRLTDFMPIRNGLSNLVRLVSGLRGQVRLHFHLALRFDYGYLAPWVQTTDYGLIAVVGPDLVALHAPVPLSLDTAAQGSCTASFLVVAGQELPFVLAYGPSNQTPPARLDTRRALADTEAYWREWAGRFKAPTQWDDAIKRSLITLKALVHRPTGGLIAAPTTSLPEVKGEGMNWDYRYCWLRDASFTLGALLNAGYHDEARDWHGWILRAIGGSPERMRIMYRVDGGRHLFEWRVPWLPGYEGSRPVRVGNNAAVQRQLDVYGELLDTMNLAARAGIAPGPQGIHLQRALVTRLEAIWTEPGYGIWEQRGEPQHYTYSKVMAWVGVDRFLQSASASACGETGDAELLERLATLRSRIHAEVCSEGYSEAAGHFVQHYGSQALDASLLLLPLVGFLPTDDPRIARTIAAVERELVQDGLVRRTADREEGAFLACTLWLADCLGLQGRKEAARASVERVLALRNDVGLLSEEYDIRHGKLTGNFPQALSHVALVNTALTLCGPVLRRGDGAARPIGT